MTAIQRFAIHGTIMNPHSHGPYVRHEDHLAAMQGRCLAQIEEPAQPVAPVLDDRWKARMLDGRAIERDEMGLGDHPELPQLDEGMKPRGFFAALGLELTHTMAEDQLDGDALEAMSDAVNWTDWQPTAPQGDGWKLVAIFDTEDGPAAWWLRELAEAEDGTTTIRSLQAEIEKLKARMARVSHAGAAPAAVTGPAPATFMTEDRACEWAWNKVREEVGTKGWTTGDSCNFYGFFLQGWRYRGQYELQRATTLAALKQELGAADAKPATAELSQAARDVLAERARQVSAEGFSPARDDQYVGGQLAGAATSYLILAAGGREDEARAFWPWRQEWLKPGSPRRYLEKVGALVLAEMERLDRAAAQAEKGCAAC